MAASARSGTRTRDRVPARVRRRDATKRSIRSGLEEVRRNYSRKVVVEGKGFVDCVLNLRSTLARTTW